jgi:hypothetical protein
MATAFAEVIGKFRDEPLKAFRTSQALAYHLLNGLISVFALYVLKISGMELTDEIDKLKAVLLAGFGSMLIMRSRLFNVKVGDEEMAFGPDQIIKIYFLFMESAIDRVRAKSRMYLVRNLMNNIDFTAVYDTIKVMLDSRQAISTEKRQKIEDIINKIRDEEPSSVQLKSYRLGYLLITEMGEDFVDELFRNPDEEWQIHAPLPREEEEGILTIIPGLTSKPRTINYFSYGASMNIETMSKILGWRKGRQSYLSSNVKPATLRGYRLVFNKPFEEDGEVKGWPNIIEDDSSVVQGVVYNLPEKTFNSYVEKVDPGYEIQKVAVAINDKKNLTALTFISIETRQGLVPSEKQLNLIIKGARANKLPSSYLEDVVASIQETDNIEDE